MFVVTVRNVSRFDLRINKALPKVLKLRINPAKNASCNNRQWKTNVLNKIFGTVYFLP